MSADQLTLDEAIANRDSILHLISIDPQMSPTIRAVAAAIDILADLGVATVSANDVRPHLPSWVKTQGIGPAFGVLIRAGALHRIGWEPSTDKGTHGKPVATYRIVARASEAAA